MGTSHAGSRVAMTIDGRKVVAVSRTPPLPPRLDGLIDRMFSITLAEDIRLTGATAGCDARIHPAFTVIREGRYFGPDRILRDLRVEMCPACGACCVRDVSYDRLEGMPVGRGGPRRRDMILGWYSGTRRNQRQYS